MNLRKLRLRLTVLYGVVSAVAVAALAVVALRLGNASIDADLERRLEARTAQIGYDQLAGREWTADDHVWNAGRNDDGSFWSSPLVDEAPVEPPLRTLAEAAWSRRAPVFDRFEQGGQRYVAYTFPVTDRQALISVASLADSDGRRAGLLAGVLAFAVAVVGLATAAGWFVAGRSLRPARQTLADQRDFLADAAHEMRTPLAVILASSSQALSRERSTEEYVRSLAEIRVAAERAAVGVNELLDLARLDSGQVIPRRAPLRLDLLAEEVAASTRVEGAVVTADPADAVVVDADLALVRQAIDNLVRNATKRASAVRISARVDGRDGVLEVADDGPGFDQAVLPRVFDRYRRGDMNGSAGMGLAIVKAIVAAHGGSAEAENRPEGGAVVRLRLPLADHALG